MAQRPPANILKLSLSLRALTFIELARSAMMPRRHARAVRARRHYYIDICRLYQPRHAARAEFCAAAPATRAFAPPPGESLDTRLRKPLSGWLLRKANGQHILIISPPPPPRDDAEAAAARGRDIARR